jgi:dTDP-glucose pyrophosphorylase
MHAVIMAGGSGTRFWPASRAGRPKQFLNVTGKSAWWRAWDSGTCWLVDTPDAVLVADLERPQDIRKIVNRLREKGKGSVL